MEALVSLILAILLAITSGSCDRLVYGDRPPVPGPTTPPVVTRDPLDPGIIVRKPVIYLYPEAETEVTVELSYAGTLTCTYPACVPTASGGRWTVTACPDGTLRDETGRQYPYLFWEGVSHTEYDLSSGFVVPGDETRPFLEEKLAYLGLSDTEAAAFISYWLPRMQGAPCNLIAFQGAAYTDSASLTVTPRPDTVLRVFMAYVPLEAPVEVPEQALTPGVRQGFTVVEWGGAELEARN